MVATGQIRATDSACKKNVATEEYLVFLFEKAKAAGAVAGDEQHLKIDARKPVRVALLHEIIGLHRLDLPVHAELFVKVPLADARHGIAVANDAAAVVALDLRGVPHMVDVAVCEQQPLNAMSVFLQPLGGSLRRVDEDARFGQEESICVEHATSKNVDFHAGRNLCAERS